MEDTLNNKNTEIESQEASGISEAVAAGSSGEHKHHHHHHSKKGRVKRRIKRFFRNNKGLAITAGVILLALVLLAVLYPMISKNGSQQNTPTPTENSSNESMVYVEPMTEPQKLISDIAYEFLQMRSYSERSSNMAKYWLKGERQDKSVPVKLTYVITAPAGRNVINTVIKISETEDMTDCRVIENLGAKRSADIDLLKTNTKYYYTVTVLFSDEQEVAASGSFVTADTPRLLSIDGIADVRDVGGWTTDDGRRVKQGLLYRGMAPYDEKNSSYRITGQGLLSLLTELGVRTDFDLRSPEDDEGFDPLGANVLHYFYNARQYTEAFESYGKESTRMIFSDLAKPEIYPAYMHCMLGTDRTGTICCILEALLGVSEEDIKTDFELTLLSHGGLQRDLFEQLIGMIKNHEGATLKEKAENLLLECGVTSEEIESIRHIFLD